jgi:hypothetical protein
MLQAFKHLQPNTPNTNIDILWTLNNIEIMAEPKTTILTWHDIKIHIYLTITTSDSASLSCAVSLFLPTCKPITFYR